MSLVFPAFTENTKKTIDNLESIWAPVPRPDLNIGMFICLHIWPPASHGQHGTWDLGASKGTPGSWEPISSRVGFASEGASSADICLEEQGGTELIMKVTLGRNGLLDRHHMTTCQDMTQRFQEGTQWHCTCQ